MSTEEKFNSVQYVHTISEAGRLLPSSSRWNSIELDFNLFPKSFIDGNFESLPSRYPKSVDYNLTIKDKIRFKRFVSIAALIILIIPALTLLKHFFPRRNHHHESSHNITLALNQALLFFDAQKSGPFVEDSLIRFRGNSGMNDGNNTAMHPDLVGGFYDAGNNIKFSFTTAYTVTLLSWTVIEYHDKYDDIGELDHVKDIIKWGSLYLLKLFVPPNTSSTSAIIYSQVGGNNSKAENDLTCWQRPEDMTYPRPVSVCDISTASDLAGELVAAMSAASMVLKEDKVLSEKLMKAAEELFILANSTQKKGMYTINDDCGGQARQFYNSSSYRDELVWGGIWLFFATGNKIYLKYATENFASAVQEQVVSDEGILDWNNKITGISILLTRIRYFWDLGYPYESSFILSTDKSDLLMCTYTSDLKYSKTEGGLILLKPSATGAALQHAATASFISKLYRDYLQLLQATRRSCSNSVFSLENLLEFSHSQVYYILGDNPLKKSYVVGYGDSYPVKLHHRAASIPWDGKQRTCSEGNQWLNSEKANPNNLLGAMVAGPNKDDVFLDERTKPWFTEPSLVSNAGLVAALIALHDPPSGSSDSSGLNLEIDKSGMFENVKAVP